MANKVLVILEQRNGKIKKASFEAAAAAKKFEGYEVYGVCAGNEVENPEEAGKYGIKEITHLKNANFENYTNSGYGFVFAEFIKETDPEVVLIPNTSLGKDLAPALAVRLDCGIAMDVIEFKFDGGNVIATRPVYAGKALLEVKVNSPRKIFALRPNVFAVGEPSGNAAEVKVKEVEAPELGSKVTEVKKSEGKLDVAEADIIVSGGRGLKEPDNFKMVEELAETLGAAVGASRAVVDAGWRPHSEQVGQTGKTVSPSLYIAIGISGAIQHLAGMRSSKYIVAINKDKDAPIFQAADYGIAGDAFEIVPELIKEIKKVKAE